MEPGRDGDPWIAFIERSRTANRADMARQDGCPMVVRIDRAGHVAEERYRVDLETLARDLKNGCQEGGVTSSVAIIADRLAPGTKVEMVRRFARRNVLPGTPITVRHHERAKA